MAVSFLYGSQSLYDAQVTAGTVNSEGIYFVNDTQRIYRGSELIAQSAIRFVTDVPTENLVPDTIYCVNKTNDDGSKTVAIYVSDGTTASPLSSAKGEVDPKAIFDALAKFTSEDAKKGWDNADDTKLVTAGAVKQALDWVLLA